MFHQAPFNRSCRYQLSTVLLGGIFALTACGSDAKKSTLSTTSVVETQCKDGIDNDGDGKVDCDDTDCQSPGGDCNPAPALDRTVVSTVNDAAAFLYTEDNLLQKDADPKAFDPKRVAMLGTIVQLREDLKAAGVTKQELFEAHGHWGRFNAHTLRHSYFTRCLARSVPEDTVRQHTGHVSNELRRYREFATSIAELHLDDLTPLDEAIPEFANVGQVGIRRSSGATQNPKLLN